MPSFACSKALDSKAFYFILVNITCPKSKIFPHKQMMIRFEGQALRLAPRQTFDSCFLPPLLLPICYFKGTLGY